MRILIAATSMLVCAATVPARASVIFTVTLGPATSNFDWTTYDASTFSFTAPDIPVLDPYYLVDGQFVRGGVIHNFVDGEDGVSFSGAELNGMPINNLAVFLEEVNGLVFADLQYISTTPLPVGALGAFQLVTPVGSHGVRLAPGRFGLGAAGIANRLQAEDPGCGVCFTSSALATEGSLTISQVADIPEPAPALFMAAGLFGLIFFQKRTRRTGKW